MGMYDGPDYPDPPDPSKTAAAQGDLNFSTAVTGNVMNMVDKYGPTGSVQYKQKGTVSVPDGQGGFYDVPQYSEVTRLSKPQRRIVARQNDAKLDMARTAANSADFLRDYMGDQMTPDGLPANGNLRSGTKNLVSNIDFDPRYKQDFGKGTTNKIETKLGYDPTYQKSYGQDGNWNDIRDQYTDAVLRRAQPGLDAQRKSLEADLVNRGVNIGSEAYSDADFNFRQGENDMQMAAILAGGDEAARMEGLARDRAAFGNSVEQQRLRDDLTAKGFRNAALGQKFAQQGQRASFGNDVQGKMLADEFSKGAFANSAEGQRFGQQLGKASFDEQQRAAALQEKFAFRNQPINEITALLSGSQIQMPQFQSPQMQGPANVDYAGLVSNIYGQQSQNAANTYAAQTDLWGNLIGGGGDLLTAGLWG